MEKPGDGRGGPTQPPKKPGSRVLGVRTIQGVLPDQFKLPEPIVEILARAPEAVIKKHSEHPPPIEGQEAPFIMDIKMREGEFYRIEDVLGQGGFGIVYRGTHFVESLQRKGKYAIDDPVAIKVVTFNKADLMSDPDGPEKAKSKMTERFETEVRLAKKLKHTNIVAIETYATLGGDLGEEWAGRPFYVMELLNGMDLDALMNKRNDRGEGPLEWGKVMPIMLQVCSALDAAHNYEEKGKRKSIIHRDIKPQNIFIETSKIGEWRVKVLDFGLAKLVAPSNPEATKKGESVGGSPWYMSPEQAWGLTVDERSDIWSVGATMYELLTGRPPFEFEILDQRKTQTSDEYNDYRVKKWAEIRDRLFNETPKPFREVNPNIVVPEEVERIVFKCMEKKPEKRFQSVAELRETIAKVIGDANGNGKQNGNPAKSAEPAYEPPVIVDDPSLVDLMEADAAREAEAQAQPKRKTPPAAAPAVEEDVPDLSEDHKTLPRYEKTEIVRIRNTAQDAAKRPTMQGAGPRKKLSKWLLIGTIAGSVAIAGIGTAIVIGTSRPSSPDQTQQDPKPVKVSNPSVTHPAPEPVALTARDGGSEAVRSAASQDAVSPSSADAGEAQAQDSEVTPEHSITLNTGIPGVQILIGTTPACRTEADGRCTINLPAQTDAVGLTFRKRGYTDIHRDVVPDQDREIRITMVERAQPVRPPGQTPPTKVPGHTPRITSE